jgi:hypothetical protein
VIGFLRCSVLHFILSNFTSPTPVEYTTLPWDLNLNARKAKEIFFAQRFVLAEEALQIGLVNKVGRWTTEHM